jgi:opacity protein-like surface antigen
VGRKARRASPVLALLAASIPLLARAQPGLTAAAATASQPEATDFQLRPKNGQDDVQQWTDRYECDAWARSESGYDPLAVPPRPSQAAREEYVRAMDACLAQHGYEVRYSPPQEPSLPQPMSYEQLRTQPSAPRELRYHALSVQAGGGYSAAAGSTADYLRNGASAGAALTWFPSAALPLGVRVEGSYTWFKPADALLALDNVGYNRGQGNMYGGEVDLRLNLAHLPAQQQLYLVAGVGWYRIDTTLQKVSEVRICGLNSCDVFHTLLAQQQDTSPWERSWNAGMGWEVALDSHTSFFVEARYRRIQTSGNHGFSGAVQLVPLWLGLRF